MPNSPLLGRNTIPTNRAAATFVAAAAFTVGLVTFSSCRTTTPRDVSGASASAELPPIRVAPDGDGFVRTDTGERFVAWGFNYDHDHAGRLLDDYWQAEWPTVVEDFAEMKALGANVVRIHLQVARFLAAPGRLHDNALERLAQLVALAESTGLYLDVTGLGCYHKRDVPPWYDALDEAARWKAQALFWGGVARVCTGSSAIFCYDLMNEPILPGKEPAQEWLAGEFAGKHFVQRITLDLAGRPRDEVARAWVERLVAAIREHDRDHMITVGVIPWATVWPNAKPLFHSAEVGAKLDFVAVHFYPEKDEVDKALRALSVYDVGKPLVVEETFPLRCSAEELEMFIETSRDRVDGWVSFYWGKTPTELRDIEDDLGAHITADWVERFARILAR